MLMDWLRQSHDGQPPRKLACDATRLFSDRKRRPNRSVKGLWRFFPALCMPTPGSRSGITASAHLQQPLTQPATTDTDHLVGRPHLIT